MTEVSLLRYRKVLARAAVARTRVVRTASQVRSECEAQRKGTEEGAEYRRQMMFTV